jgi:hypothetical protein
MKRPFIFFLFIALIVAGCNEPPLPASDKRLTVYPNPAIQNAYIAVNPQGSSYTLAVYDYTGKEISPTQTSTDQYSINLPGQGTYYVILKIKNDVVKQTVVRL